MTIEIVKYSVKLVPDVEVGGYQLSSRCGICRKWTRTGQPEGFDPWVRTLHTHCGQPQCGKVTRYKLTQEQVIKLITQQVPYTRWKDNSPLAETRN